MQKSLLHIAVLICSILLLLNVLCFAQTTEPAAGDSLQADTLLSGMDIFEMTPDSTAHAAATNTWLFPLGMIAATGVVIYLLFSTRSH